MHINPVILSGGSGTRLWPLSREHYPKQLLSLLGESTLLQDTANRLDGLESSAPPLIVCNEQHRFLVAEQLREIGKSPSDIILESKGRNTAPALTLAALSLAATGSESHLMLVMPADHVIKDIPVFHEAVGKAARLAQNGSLVTFGIVPASAETGYGYIKIDGDSGVAAFVEKPDQNKADEYFASGKYLWNSGMFMIRVETWLEQTSRYCPDILSCCQQAYAGVRRDSDFCRVDQKIFEKCPSDSIDYAVMEKTDKAAYVPFGAGWSDIGSWSSLWEEAEQDKDGNVLKGLVYSHNTKNSFLNAQHRLLATVGVNNLVVIETPDAVLVADRDRAHEVTEIVKRLKREDREEYKSHRRVYRPWGYYESVDAGDRFQVKRITVKPGAALSLQMHHHRAEHWVVVSGTAKVTKGEDTITLTENESIYIPIGTKHRLENPGSIALEIIEVQSGSYLGEDDIIRFEDIYHRKTELQ